MEIRIFKETDLTSENDAVKAQAHLTSVLAEASRAYYNTGIAKMSDEVFDRMCHGLKAMEEENGFTYNTSPTIQVGGEPVKKLKEVTHKTAALSLDKVKYKDRENLKNWLMDREGVLSLKCDGSTIVATYEGGRLVQAATRGNGIQGSDITHNAVHIVGLPERIPYTERLVVRGEAMMTFSEFDRVNEQAGDIYENARNLANATIMMLDPEESKKREIIFRAFKLVEPAPSEGELAQEINRFAFLKAQGIRVVKHILVSKDTILDKIEEWKETVNSLDYPTDGLVLSFNDQVFAESLGNTGHHPRGSIAMKWTDETKETTIREIEWSVGKSGVVTPVAIFDSVRLGVGSNVTRASLHNLSIAKHIPSLEGIEKGFCTVGVGSKVRVYLANMIIPQVAAGTEGKLSIPGVCPVCGEPLTVRNNESVETIWCLNPDCAVKHSKRLETFFSKDGCYAKGLGSAQIQDLLSAGLVTTHPLSFFRMVEEHKKLPTELNGVRGWGKLSWENVRNAILEAQKTDLTHFLYALSIPLLGHDLSKKLNKAFCGDIKIWAMFVKNPDKEMLAQYDGIGEIKAGSIVDWCNQVNSDSVQLQMFEDLVSCLDFQKPEVTGNSDALAGKTFVITGNVHIYKNRAEFTTSVEARGGKVSSTVSAKTTYLVNNSLESTSGKNKKARELGIKVISEDQFIKMFGK